MLILSANTFSVCTIFKYICQPHQDVLLLPPSPGCDITVGHLRRAAAGLPAGPPQGKCLLGAGETTNSCPAERRTGQLSETAVSASTGAAALGEREGKAPPASGGHRGSAATERGGVQTAGGEVSSCPACGTDFNN